MFVDGLAGCGDDLVSMTSEALGADVKLAGGAAGDNLAFRATHILHNGQAHANSVGLCMIHSKVPVRTAATHGHYPFGDTMTITRAQPRRIYEIDGKNAWQVWLDATRQRREEMGFTDEALKSQDVQSRFFPSFEMGLASKQGGYKLRGIMTAHPDGSLGLYSDVAEGDQFRIMYSDETAQLNALERAANLAVAHKATKPAGALIFDCVVRSSILGDEFYPSIQSFHQALQGVPFIGFETYGEICLPSLFFEGFLNTTSVVVILPD
jgi:methyl-accepting chemotaxis protein